MILVSHGFLTRLHLRLALRGVLDLLVDLRLCLPVHHHPLLQDLRHLLLAQFLRLCRRVRKLRLRLPQAQLLHLLRLRLHQLDLMMFARMIGQRVSLGRSRPIGIAMLAL